MIDFTVLGYVAAFCTTCSFVPQVFHILKTGDTKSISLAMYSCFVFGVFLWLVYGIAMQDWPIIVANAITLMLASMILLLKVRDVARAKKAPPLSV
ncbi:SemiSWEET transporter [Vibrio panuliri]|uniref:Glutathione synthetase n=1 Tax=Vibrio panuliri TaxID=1381081 RepID=A0A1Q9HDX5_9VIBR|nr:SemiSWEET transporter [Vibrio panuliri]KAB1454924.1 glutathione synthetase [Vibrio panuliri]OLQ86034.1 glutathione synthetase [Vibrio panuliri]OLQ87909.1 glutathione synthetase [Vibrio panuliri]